VVCPESLFVTPEVLDQNAKAKGRRRFLIALGGGAGAIGAYFGLNWFFGDPRDVTVAVLHRRCGGMYVNEDTFERFAGEYADWKGRTDLLRHLSALSLPLGMWSPYEWVLPLHRLRRLEDSIVTQYLLSTDFFLHGANLRREIQYMSFYDPMITACRNPFFQPAD
jgi:hypothetical protein